MGRVLALLGRGVLAFHPRLVEMTGGVTSALMLSQSLYWTKVLASQRDPRGGWFWKTREDWRSETSLTRHEQDGARAKLAGLGFWQERRVGMPARLWYRVDLEALAGRLDADFSGRWDWSDEQAMLRVLGRPILLYRALADITGSVTSALLLSRFMTEERLRLRGSSGVTGGDWTQYDQAGVLAATGLTRAEFYHARKVLREAGFIAERRVGLPPRSEWRLDLEAIAAALEAHMAVVDARQNHANAAHGAALESDRQGSLELLQSRSNEPETRAVVQLAENRTSSMRQTRRQGFAGPAALSAKNPQTGNTESGQLEISIPANKMAENRTTSRPDSGRPIKGLTTGKPTTYNHPPSPLAGPAAPTVATTVTDAGGGGVEIDFNALVWPAALLEAERPDACKLLRRLPPAECQHVLDELAGQSAQQPIRQPLAYLRRLAEQVLAGTFVALAAARVRAGRERARQLAAERARSGLDAPAETARVELSEAKRAERRAQLAEMSKMLGRKSGWVPTTQS